MKSATHFSFRVSDEFKLALKKLKDRDGIPASEAIKRGTTEFLKSRGIAVETKKGAKRTKK